MKGTLVKWVHSDEPSNICVIIRAYLQEQIEEEIGHDDEIEDDNPLFLVYDMTTNEYFYALEDELHFI